MIGEGQHRHVIGKACLANESGFTRLRHVIGDGLRWFYSTCDRRGSEMVLLN